MGEIHFFYSPWLEGHLPVGLLHVRESKRQGRRSPHHLPPTDIGEHDMYPTLNHPRVRTLDYWPSRGCSAGMPPDYAVHLGTSKSHLSF